MIEDFGEFDVIQIEAGEPEPVLTDEPEKGAVFVEVWEVDWFQAPRAGGGILAWRRLLEHFEVGDDGGYFASGDVEEAVGKGHGVMVVGEGEVEMRV